MKTAFSPVLIVCMKPFIRTEEPDFLFTSPKFRPRRKIQESAIAYERFLDISPQTDVERRDRIKGLIKFLHFLETRKSLYIIGGEYKTPFR